MSWLFVLKSKFIDYRFQAVFTLLRQPENRMEKWVEQGSLKRHLRFNQPSKRMPQYGAKPPWCAVNVNIGHGFVGFVEYVVGV